MYGLIKRSKSGTSDSKTNICAVPNEWPIYVTESKMFKKNYLKILRVLYFILKSLLAFIFDMYIKLNFFCFLKQKKFLNLMTTNNLSEGLRQHI